jgi:hypothetical protein
VCAAECQAAAIESAARKYERTGNERDLLPPVIPGMADEFD